MVSEIGSVDASHAEKGSNGEMANEQVFDPQQQRTKAEGLGSQHLNINTAIYY